MNNLDNLEKWMLIQVIQYAKNTSHHSGIGMSPFKAMFGCVEKVGISNKLPKYYVPC